MQAQADTISVEKLLDLHSKQMMIINPEYQRGAIWTATQKKKLVDSVLRGYPIPLIYLHHIKDEAAGLVSERFEIIDGQQRINAMWEFLERAFELLHPKDDEAEARFPDFVKKQPCPWGGLCYRELTVDLQQQFLATPLPIVRIETHDSNEARDLFVRLQAGIPLNSQEKRDAWPGQFTDFILRLGGKPGIARYKGHEFFDRQMKARMTKDRGKYRQLAAQLTMLFLTRRRSDGESYCDINAKALDDFYYENLGFDGQSSEAIRLFEILDKITQLLSDQKRKKILAHEAIHLVLLVDSLLDDYTRSWEAHFTSAFDHFREQLAIATKTKIEPMPAEYWLRYGIHARTNSDRSATIRRRHEFFLIEMFKRMTLQPRDPQRLFGPVEREIIYYRDRKLCAVCQADVTWSEGQIHHVERHSTGGPTVLENGVLVHKHCHPKSKAAEEQLAQKLSERADGGDELE